MMESGNASEGNSAMGNSSNASDGSAQTPYPLPMALATLVLSVAGLVGNLLIVLAMLRSRKLQNKCSALIGALAATDFIICAYLTQLRVIILLDGDSSKWTNAQCLTVSVHGIFALSVQSGLGLAIGIDRLLAIRLPHLYNKWPACTYLTALSTPILAYATLLTLFAFRESTETPVWVCMPPTAYSGKARQLWVASNIVIVLFVLITYGLAHHIVRRK
uniref:G-protein coupled receptors family 1 profile domain-containing protein n=1 Tax=Plectus sambesii TaxID=2011161 RepID=A0A914UUN2_9BILA